MVIISESKPYTYGGYSKTQFRYGMVYVVITLVALIILNIYCAQACQRLFCQSKEAALVEKCLLACDEINSLEVLTPSAVSGTISQMESLKIDRLLVTDQRGSVLYDSGSCVPGSFALLPEILTALKGNDVFSWNYQQGAIRSRVAVPLLSYGTIVGCVYMAENDNTQGFFIEVMQYTILRITLVLETLVILFTLFFSAAFSRRLNKIMTSMKIIQEGDYTHKVVMGGNDELTVLGNEFNDLTERLKTSEEKRSRFVSDASHELKTPLASIKLLTDSILQNDMDAETMREFVQDIGSEAERLNRMTEKLLSLTRSECAPTQESEIIPMAPTVRRVARMLKTNAQQAQVSFCLDLKQDSPILILEDDLYQIVFNLMENGIKYNVPGGSLTVRLHREEDNAILEVSDTGMGIPADAREHIFERFYRVDKARSRATGGSGLGLAIVRTIVRRNRGDIRVESILGKGSTFIVTFPVFDTEVDPE